MMRAIDIMVPRQYLVFEDVDQVRESPYYQHVAMENAISPKVHDISNIIERSLTTGEVKADEIVSVLFPQKYSDVFISHSHAEIDVASALKAKIEHELGLTCFIDGDVWGNVYEALEFFQKRWELNKGENSLIQCNYAASHFYLMLSSALMQMMGQAHAIVFIKPEAALPSDEQGGKISLESAWIRQELLVAKQLMATDEVKELFWRGPIMSAQRTKQPRFFYNVDLQGFHNMPFDALSLIRERMNIAYWQNYKCSRMRNC